MMVPMVARCFRLCRWYWLRDATVSASTNFYFVYTTGYAGYSGSAAYYNGVLPRLHL